MTFNAAVGAWFGALCGLVACAGPSAGGDDAVVPDAGADAGELPDAPGVWTTDVACGAAAEAIYVTAGMTAGARGSIVTCAAGETLDAARVQSEMAGDGAEGVVAETGVRVIKVAYRTVRSDGSAAISTATAYLPLVPRGLPAPVVLIGRPTSGIADACAPSKGELPEKNLALPFAARGFVTITPDFAGLGNEGTHAYLDNHEAAGQLLDGARALQALVPGGVVGDPIAAVGYSQGGGVVLSTQALEYAITGKHTLRAVAALAPQWPISTRSFGYEDVLRNPDRFTGLAGLAPPTVTVLRHYGFIANKMAGQLDIGAAFPAGERSSIIGAVESLCTVPLGGALGSQQPRLRDLVDPELRAQILGCIDGTADCAGTGAAFHAWLTGDFVTADPTGARVLIVQGLGDQVMPAAGEAACDVAKLRAEGVQPDVLTDTLATHDTILERKIEDVVTWVEAVATGTPAPTVSSNLPNCSR